MGKRKADNLLGAQMPLFSLRSCLNISVDAGGIRLSLVPPFGIFNPALFIPWDELTVKLSHTLASTWVEFRFKREPDVCLRIREPVGREVMSYSPGKIFSED